MQLCFAAEEQLLQTHQLMGSSPLWARDTGALEKIKASFAPSRRGVSP